MTTNHRLREFHKKNEGVVDRRIRVIEKEPCGEILQESMKHLREILRQAEIPIEECDSCHFTSKSELFTRETCAHCDATITGCRLEGCLMQFYFPSFGQYYCLDCLRNAMEEKKCENSFEISLHEMKVRKLKREEEEEEKEIVYFPYFEKENISSDLVGMSATLREERESKENPYFDCDLCMASHPMKYYMGDCYQCQKKLGLCCYYRDQWCDRIDNYEEEEDLQFTSSVQFLCPVCIEEESLSFSSYSYSSSSDDSISDTSDEDDEKDDTSESNDDDGEEEEEE